MDNITKKNISYNTSLISLEELTKCIENAVVMQQGYSFIRLGDGEGALLDLDLNSSLLDIKYLAEHFGDECSLNELLEVQNILKNSLEKADMVGVRDDVVNVTFPNTPPTDKREFLNLFKNSFHLRKVDKNICYNDAHRVALLHKSVTTFRFSKNTKYVSPFIGWEYYSSGALPHLLATQEKIAIVSSRKEIAKTMSEALGIDVIQYVIPDKHELQNKQSQRHYPTAYNKLIKSINVEFKGMIFIVAGGLVGKGYCQAIKSKGGVALDLGGVVDAWVGKLSRPAPLKERYDLKTSWKVKMRRKIIPTFKRSYDLPDELIMNKDNIKLLANRWLNSRPKQL